VIKRWLVRSSLVLVLAFVTFGCAAAPQPTLKIVGPADGATVQGPKVKVDVTVDNFKLVAAGAAPAEGEGHVHFFVDVPATSVAVGQPIPATTANPAYIHAGAAPFTSRELTLTPGKHTITAVVGNAAHIALASPAPQTITITVQ
jgi:hypothetical protein